MECAVVWVLGLFGLACACGATSHANHDDGAGTGPGGSAAAPGGTTSDAAGTPSAGGRGPTPDGGSGAAADTGGAGGKGPASGGASNAGSSQGGGAGAPGGGSSGDAALPSSGCALADAEPEEDSDVIYSYPSGYDGVEPVPLIVVFHATNMMSDVQQLIKNQPGAERYLVLAPQQRAAGLGSFEGIMPATYLSRLAAWRTKLCFDERRSYAVGNGSGGRFLMTLVSYLSSLDTKEGTPGQRQIFRAVSLIGTYSGKGSWSPLPTLFMHPLDSANSAGVAQDRDGLKALAILTARNTCGETTAPADVAGCVRGTTTEPSGCVDFQGCSAPLRFCHYDEPYTSGDPWPCFASPAIYDYFDHH